MDVTELRRVYKYHPNIQVEDVINFVISSVLNEINAIDKKVEEIDLSALVDILQDDFILKKVEASRLDNLTSSIFSNICIPLLQRIATAETLVGLDCVTTLCNVTKSVFTWCVRKAEDYIAVLEICLKLYLNPGVASSSIYDTDSQSAGLQITSSLVILKCIIQSSIDSTHNNCDIACSVLKYLKNNLWSCIVKTLFESNNSTAVKLLSDVVIPMMKLCEITSAQLLQVKTDVAVSVKLEGVNSDQLVRDLWNEIKSVSERLKNEREDAHRKYIERQLLVLCCISDYVLHASKIEESLVVHDNSFWDIVQIGMMEMNCLSYKRSVYLLKRIIDTCDKSGIVIGANLACKFYWSASDKVKLTTLWEDFLLLVESLEETQAHLVKPLFPKVKPLLCATVDAEDCPRSLLHPSWLVVLFRRCLSHNSISIIRWAVATVLDLDSSICRKMCRDEPKFLFSTFIKCLQEMKLYSRSQDLGAAPEVAKKLGGFFKSCWKAFDDHNQKGEFFRQILKTLSENYWSGVSLMFICQALSEVPTSPLLDSQAVLHIRDLITRHISSMEVYIRGATQCFLLQTFIQLIDIRLISLDEFVTTIGMFSAEECLRRGTVLWKECVDHLQHLMYSGDSEGNAWCRDNICKFLDKFHHDIIKNEDYSGLLKEEASRKLGRFMLMIADTDTTENMDKSLKNILDKLAHTLNSVNSHAYMPTLTADRSLSLLMMLNNESGNRLTKFDLSLKESYRSCHLETMEFIRKKIIEDLNKFSDIAFIDMYCEFMKLMISEGGDRVCDGLHQLVQYCIKALQHLKTQSITEQTQVCLFSCMRMLGCIGEVLAKTCSSTWNRLTILLSSFAKDVLEFKLQKPAEISESLNENWGKILSQYMSSQWYCVHLHLTSGNSDTDFYENSLEALDTCSCLTVIPIFKCLKLIVIKNVYIENQDKIISALEFCWKRVEEQEKRPPYKGVLKEFVELSYQPVLLKYPSDSRVLHYLIDLAKSFIESGEDRRFSTNILTSHLCQMFLQTDLSTHLLKFVSLVTDMLIFGGIRTQQTRYVSDAGAYIESLGLRCSVNEISEGISKADMHTRTNAVNFLSCLQKENTDHIHFVDELLESLIEKHQHYLKIIEYRSYANSILHRKKNRLAQMFVLLFPFIHEGNVDTLWKHLWNALSQEPQPSVRNLLEWAVMMIIQKFPHYLEELFEKTNMFKDGRNMCTYSVMVILSFMGPLLCEEKQNDFYEKTIHFLLPWCMAQHFNARIYAQGCLMKVWKQCQKLQILFVLESCKLVESCIQFTLHNSNSTKNIEKLMKHYLFSTFDINRDFSLETIFHTIPKLAKMNEDEWIPCELFQQLDPTLKENGNRAIPLHNPSDELSKCDPGVWKFKVSDVTGDTENNEASGGFNVQKKSQPWKTMSPEDDVITFGEFRKAKSPLGNLIVITSLIDKIPNIGGLCRTCEIFGVSELVMSNLRDTEDKVFQVLSVTSHKWLPLKEVSPSALPEYLDFVKNEGYTLVGIEQTANSTSLSNYKFPEKTVLLLGNEKEGIPVELLNMLDICVEIPQHGVVRSLNVHVSGAIFIWEYTRQQLIKT